MSAKSNLLEFNQAKADYEKCHLAKSVPRQGLGGTKYGMFARLTPWEKRFATFALYMLLDSGYTPASHVGIYIGEYHLEKKGKY